MKRADLERAALLSRALDDWAGIEEQLKMAGRVVIIDVAKADDLKPSASVMVPIQVGRKVLAGVRKILEHELAKLGVTT